MYYVLEKTNKNIIEYCGNTIKLLVEDFYYLDNYEKLMTEIFKEDTFTKIMHLSDEIISLCVNVIINDKDTEYLKEKLIQNNFPLFSLIINQVRLYQDKYRKLLDLKDCECFIVVCNKENIIESLELAKRSNKKVIIEGTSMLLAEYRKILSTYDINGLDKVSIRYQEKNSPLSVKELLETSVIIDDISKEVEKYNLSPLEKIIYVYDFVKKKEYKENIDNLKDSRDIDRVLKGEYIVCAGYSNLFNAILKNLGINAISFIGEKRNHQRSLVYIKDSKYNVDGVYVFDPTWDSKKDDIYINNYRYFGLPFEKSEREMSSTIRIKPNFSFADLVRIFSIKNIDSNEAIDKINELEELFTFVGEETFNELNENINFMFIFDNIKDRVREIYNSFISKYNSKEISAGIFMLALYNTRMIEYYNGLVDNFDIEEIMDASKNRSIFQKINYEKFGSDIHRILIAMDYSDEIDNELYRIINEKKSYLDRDKQNIKLKVRKYK